MTNRGPVLSVTYGAFSLTLEGFDDPFATMRDVAEYFRTVLAEDRGFGSRPAAPRAEALRLFAEGRSGRAVEARAGGGPLHLRAAGPAAARLRAVPEAAALLDEEAQPVAVPAAPAAFGAKAAGVVPSEGDGDPLAAALDEARADALPDGIAPGDTAGRNAGLEAPADSGPGRRAALPAEADEVALERLISQADSALAVPEAQRRRANFALLKAAVAATRAEADAGGAHRPPGQAAEIAQYRDVLAQGAGATPPAARRPRDDSGQPDASAPPAPDAGTDAAPPSAEPRPAVQSDDAPLLLTADRRLSGDGGANGPRRIGPTVLTMEALFDEGPSEPEPADPGFARFLAAASPSGTAELIDAAAAYLAHVERLEEFPRQQLMRLIAPGTAGVSREEVLRAFGTLLREGRLHRSRRGQMQSTARSAYGEAARRFREKG